MNRLFSAAVDAASAAAVGAESVSVRAATHSWCSWGPFVCGLQCVVCYTEQQCGAIGISASLVAVKDANELPLGHGI